MPPKSVKHPCGVCSKTTVQTKALSCAICEFWFHCDCVEGMTEEFFESCGQAFATWGYSAFFCKCCRKATAKMTKTMKELKEEIDKLEKRIATMEKEREQVTKRVDDVEERAERMKAGLEGMEREVTSGMEKAKEEVKKEVHTEMKEQEERSENLVIYGLKERNEEEAASRMEAEKGKVLEMAGEVGVELTTEEVEVKFRAGKKPEEGARPRPLIVKVKNEEKRERIRKNARLLSRTEEWKTVFISEDLTWQQREEARKQEKSLREEADRKTEEAKKEGKKGKFRIVGPRGRRRMVWVEE